MPSRIFAIGDVMGKPGRNCIKDFLPKIKQQYDPDILVVNGENAAGGFGLTKKIYDQFIEQFGISCITSGNHWHDKREIYQYLPELQRLVLPANMNNVADENHGLKIFKTPGGKEFAVINLIGKAFMNPDNRCPFQTAMRLLDKIPSYIKIRIVDMHSEASSEKQAMARFLDGKVSLVYGTHSHVPTADERILPQGTGFVTDLGLTGSYNSVIGIRIDSAIERMMTGVKKNFEPAKGDEWLCALYTEIDDDGRCCRVERVRWQREQMDIYEFS